MAQEYYFFDSTKDDIRRYQARHLAEILDTVLQTGLLHKDGTPTIRVVANTKDMKVRVTAGKAVMKGHLYINTDDYEITLPKTDTVKRIVLRLDTNIDNRYIKLFVTEGDTNFPKPLVRENGVYELALCQIKFDASKGYIEQTDIVDTRFNENLCGLAHSLITVPTTEYQKEWNEFVQRYEKWFQQHQNSSYATLDYVKRNDDELRRLIAEIQLGGGGGGVIEGLSFATDFNNFQNIALKTGAAKTTGIYSKSVSLEKSISGLTAGDGVTLYDGTNQEQLTVSSVSGLTVNFTTTITKSFKAGASLARSMGVLESGKNQYSFGGWGNTRELIDYKATETITGTRRFDDARIQRALYNDGLLYVSYGNYYSSMSEYLQGILIYDLMAKKPILKEQVNAQKLATDLGYSAENDDVFYTTLDKNGAASIKYYRKGVLLKEENLTNVKDIGSIRYKYGYLSVSYNNGLKEIRKFYGDGSTTVVAKTTSDSVNTRPSLFLGRDVYVCETNSRSVVRVRINGDNIEKLSTSLFSGDRDDGSLNLAVANFAGDKLVISVSNTTYGRSVFVMPLDEAINSGGEMNVIKDDGYGKVTNLGRVVNTNKPGMPLIFYNSNSGNINGKGDMGIGVDGTIVLVNNDRYTDRGTSNFAYVEFRKEEGVDLKNNINSYPIVILPSTKTTTSDLEITTSSIIGNGQDLTSNDVRFKLPKKSNGISATVTAGSGISVKARFGNVDLVGVEKNGQTQFAGMSSAAHDELTLTMKRLSTSNTNGLKRVTGGIDA